MFTAKNTNQNKFFPQLNSDITTVQKSRTINLKNDELSNENIPDVLDEGWDLPL